MADRAAAAGAVPWRPPRCGRRSAGFLRAGTGGGSCRPTRLGRAGAPPTVTKTSSVPSAYTGRRHWIGAVSHRARPGERPAVARSLAWRLDSDTCPAAAFSLVGGPTRRRAPPCWQRIEEVARNLPCRAQLMASGGGPGRGPLALECPKCPARPMGTAGRAGRRPRATCLDQPGRAGIRRPESWPTPRENDANYGHKGTYAVSGGLSRPRGGEFLGFCLENLA